VIGDRVIGKTEGDEEIETLRAFFETLPDFSSILLI
jgi:hypothetical protein